MRDVVKLGKLGLLAAPAGLGGALIMNSDALFCMGILAEDQGIEHTLESNKHAWLQMVRGELMLNGIKLNCGDGAPVSEESVLKICVSRSSEFLLLELN